MKLRVTEEFLWLLYDLLEDVGDAYISLSPRSWKDIASPEWRSLRLAYKKKNQAKSFSQFISYLKQKGYIEIPSGEIIQLTEKGKSKALEAKTKGTKWPDRKDGKMIMLMYDIPEERKEVRYAFRNALILLDYKLLQKSVWISTKDVLTKTQEAVSNFDLDSYVDIFVIEKIHARDWHGQN
ncbi:MAG: hypothetical protein Q8P70_00070 [bacterium]|nr:hypothetical protein [bacterium]